MPAQKNNPDPTLELRLHPRWDVDMSPGLEASVLGWGLMASIPA